MIHVHLKLPKIVSTHSRLKAAGRITNTGSAVIGVSTHSRLKAAGRSSFIFLVAHMCFNTQPPEGGWFKI